jgi:DNA-binding response OmpR family regulator
LKILVVEDNVEISEALGFFCSEKKDIDCDAANTGRDGLDRIRKEHFDLILLDLAMPEFSGKDVVQSFTKDQYSTKEHCHLYRFIRSGGLGTNEKYWY